MLRTPQKAENFSKMQAHVSDICLTNIPTCINATYS